MPDESGRLRADILLIFLGACLLALFVLGQWTAMGRYESLPPRSWERFDPELAEATPDLASLYRAAEDRAAQPLRGMAPADAMQVLYETVADRFTHGDRSTYNFFSNWILWALGAAVPRYRDIQDPDILLRAGHSALCGEVSYVLMHLAAMTEIPARHALLGGHIIMEARYDGSWHAYDPDLEVVARDDDGGVASVEVLERRPGLVRRSYAGRGDAVFVAGIAAIYASVGNNRSLTYPARSFLGPSGQRPGRVEQAARPAAYLLPAALIAVGGALEAAGRRRRRNRRG